MRANAPKTREVAAPAKVLAEPKEDHRVRTGAFRREQTRRRLLAAAMPVFAEKGTDAPSIEDFIAAAGVARGTFYNYFSTTQELLDAVTSELSDAIITRIDKVVLPIPDPLERLSCGCLVYMHLGVDAPSWSAFVMRAGVRSKATGKLLDAYVSRDLKQAHKAGYVSYPTVRAARDLVVASISQAIQSVNAGDAPREHLRQMLVLCLRGLGVASQTADQMSQLPVPHVELPEGVFGAGA